MCPTSELSETIPESIEEKIKKLEVAITHFTNILGLQKGDIDKAVYYSSNSDKKITELRMKVDKIAERMDSIDKKLEMLNPIRARVEEIERVIKNG